MVNKLYSIRDHKSGFYPPVVDTNDDTAKRNFSFAMNNNENYAFAPADYDLYYVGSFDSETGLITCDHIPTLVASGVNVYAES